VRGHHGHLLNETADRLAVAARKAHNRGRKSIDVQQTLAVFGDRAPLLHTNSGQLRIRS
jgi:ribonuclease HI